MKTVKISILILVFSYNFLYSIEKTYSHSFSLYSGTVLIEQHPPNHFSFGLNYELLPFHSNTFGVGLSGEYRGGGDSYSLVSLPLYLHFSENTKMWLAPSIYIGDDKTGESLDGEAPRIIKELFLFRLGVSTGFNIDWLYISPFINIGLSIQKMLLFLGLNFEVRI